MEIAFKKHMLRFQRQTLCSACDTVTDPTHHGRIMDCEHIACTGCTGLESMFCLVCVGAPRGLLPISKETKQNVELLVADKVVSAEQAFVMCETLLRPLNASIEKYTLCFACNSKCVPGKFVHLNLTMCFVCYYNYS